MRIGCVLTPVLLAAVLAVSACSGDPADVSADGSAAPAPVVSVATPEFSQPATQPDPCKLLTKADAEKLTRTPLDDAVAVLETCTYTGPVTGPTAQVEIYVGDGAKKMLDVDRDLQHAFTPVTGAGDEAYLEDGVVFVRKGETWVAIRLVLLNDPAANRIPLENAARTVAGRL
ncbi:MAG: hypothetical protein HOV77_21885 [Hamadaea sp.]|uniref:hypothetical protein n=1 Tax=Hamadaea sp. TaxID=2024425 RepID=UPI00178ED735|nr:hypothetical protein [Hamadaea sp.]NUT21834.1 hypothetical protein [Hamadaea sp.]